MVSIALKDYLNNGLWVIKLLRRDTLPYQNYLKLFLMLSYMKDGLKIRYLLGKKDHTEHISFINIDCDLYKSTQTILSLLNDQIVSGTLLRFDDLLPSHISPYPKWEEGEWKALSEWCIKFKRKVIPMARSWKQGCIMKVDV